MPSPTGRSTAAQYTTVLKLLQIMTEKGLVERDETERAHVYRASRPPEWTRTQLSGDLLHRAFNGSAKSLILGALSACKTSKRELAEIRKLLDEYDFGCGGICSNAAGTMAKILVVGSPGKREQQS
jgi:predicted transcriptional regulator